MVDACHKFQYFACPSLPLSFFLSLSPHLDSEARAPVVEQRDVCSQIPSRAAVYRPLRLAELLELLRTAEEGRLEGAHGQNRRVREQVGTARPRSETDRERELHG